jgi:hypothetical protein
MPLIGPMEARRFQQTQGLVAMSVLSLAADTRKAYVLALAAEETVRYMRQVKQAAGASAELARRMEQVGNFNKLQRAREQVSTPTRAQPGSGRAGPAVHARAADPAAGPVGSADAVRLPERLPDLPRPRRWTCPTSSAGGAGTAAGRAGRRLAAEQTASNLG